MILQPVNIQIRLKLRQHQKCHLSTFQGGVVEITWFRRNPAYWKAQLKGGLEERNTLYTVVQMGTALRSLLSPTNSCRIPEDS
jgi:hypothetical protein